MSEELPDSFFEEKPEDYESVNGYLKATDRGYFAGQAMKGLIVTARRGFSIDFFKLAQEAITAADALIAELEKEKK